MLHSSQCLAILVSCCSHSASCLASSPPDSSQGVQDVNAPSESLPSWESSPNGSYDEAGDDAAARAQLPHSADGHQATASPGADQHDDDGAEQPSDAAAAAEDASDDDMAEASGQPGSAAPDEAEQEQDAAEASGAAGGLSDPGAVSQDESEQNERDQGEGD